MHTGMEAAPACRSRSRLRSPGWTGSPRFFYKRASRRAQVAQLVEQRTENPCVGGSIPPLGTTVLSNKTSDLDDRKGRFLAVFFGRKWSQQESRISKISLRPNCDQN